MLLIADAVDLSVSRGLWLSLLAKATPISAHDLPGRMQEQLVAMNEQGARWDAEDMFAVAWGCKIEVPLRNPETGSIPSDAKTQTMYLAGWDTLERDPRILIDGPINIEDLEGWVLAAAGPVKPTGSGSLVVVDSKGKPKPKAKPKAKGKKAA